MVAYLHYQPTSLAKPNYLVILPINAAPHSFCNSNQFVVETMLIFFFPVNIYRLNVDEFNMFSKPLQIVNNEDI